MKLNTHLAFLVVLIAALISGWCNGPEPPKPPSTPTPAPSTKTNALARLSVQTGKEVTFYPTYGYRVGTGWNAQLRGWVHEHRKIEAEAPSRLLKLIAKCDDTQMKIVRSRSADLMDDDKNFEKVKVKFDSDPENKEYDFSKTESEGIYKLDLAFTDEKAKQLLEQQHSSNGWLTYRATSENHTGLGRVRLIEPDPNGVSLISDIDDTIKITEVPAGQATVLKNTFCLPFRAVPEPDLLAKYKLGDDIPVHYVSGGPEQLFGPLYDFLIIDPGGFPEGTFHLKFFPKNPSIASASNIVRSLISSLDATYDHKLHEITTLMDRFPDRKFILVGDSGEVDPEVYNEIKKQRPAQVKEIVIRDVINDAVVNPFRLAGMTPIPVNPPICVEQTHFEHLSKKVEKFHPERPKPYIRNPACGKD
jgi:phosphatidate phosphatase APP1